MINEIQQHIVKAQIGEALQKGLEWSKETNNRKLHDTILQLQYRYAHLQNQHHDRTISAQDYELFSNQICKDLIKSIQKLPSDTPNSIVQPYGYAIVFTIIVIAAILIGINQYLLQNSVTDIKPPIKDVLLQIDSAEKVHVTNREAKKTIHYNVTIDTSKVKLPKSLVDSINTLKLPRSSASTTKKFVVQFSIGPELRIKNPERNTYNYDGGPLTLIVNNEIYTLDKFHIRHFRHPMGYQKQVLENLIFEKIENELKKDNNEQIVWEFLENHIG